MKNFLTAYIQPLVAFTFCFLLFCQLPAMAQTQNDDVKIGVLPNQMHDTRSLSMASTTIADLYGRPSIGINAALSGLINDPSFLQFNTNKNWDNQLLQYDLMLPTLSIDSHHITTRFGILHKGFENFPFKSTSSLPKPDLTMYRAELAYAFAFSNYFSLGTLQSISYVTSDGEASFWNYFADIGLAYAPDGPVTYGMVFRGLGQEITYETIEDGQTALGRRMARQILEIGVTFRYPTEDRTYLSISFSNEKRFGQDGLWYKGGVDVLPVSSFSIRGGMMVNFDQSLFIPRMGLGINTSAIQFDYMIAPKNLIGEHFHQIGLTIAL